MKKLTQLSKFIPRSLLLGATAAALHSFYSHAWPVGRTTFYTDAPFVGTNSAHAVVATGMQNLVTFSAWADTEATVPANVYQWWWIFGVDSGTGNGALIDGNESLTLDFDKSVGAGMIYFLYTGGSGGANNMARIRISGFASDPGALAVTWNAPRISNITYENGTVTFDYLDDAGNDFGQVMFSNPAASAGRRLKITGGISPNGNATSWFAALYRVDVEEAFASSSVGPIHIPHNTVNTFTTTDGSLTIKGYADRNATIAGNLGRYENECFGVYGQHGGNVVDTNEAISVQFSADTGLSRLDSVYSGGEFAISGFLSDPGFVDPAFGASAAVYLNGTLTVTLANGSLNSFYFNNRAASAGRTLVITVSDTPGSQLGIGRIGYAKLPTLTGADVAGNWTATHSTPDGMLTLTAYANTPGTETSMLWQNIDWFGISGGNNEAIDGAESMALQFSTTVGLSAIGTRYTSGQVVMSGFISDPGFADPSGTATGVSYSNGTLTYAFNAPTSPERVIWFTNPGASKGQTLSVHTDGTAGAQIALTRIAYAIPQARLAIDKLADKVVLAWPAGILQQSSSVDGIYVDVLGATSPYTNNASGGPKYFRLKM